MLCGHVADLWDINFVAPDQYNNLLLNDTCKLISILIDVLHLNSMWLCDA